MNMIDGLKWLCDNKIDVKTVLDVGASNGQWSRDCIKFFLDSNYVLFEPQPFHFNDLIEFSKNNKVKVVYKAVGSSVGTTFFDANEPFGGSLTDHDGEKIIKVDLTTIDNTVQELKSEGPYLIKLDTHGFEMDILDGSIKTLEETNVLVIECYNYVLRGGSLLFWQICEYLFKKEFRPVHIVDNSNRKYDNSLWQMDIFFMKSSANCFKYNAYI